MVYFIGDVKIWLIPTKKEVKKSFNKIKSAITELTSQSLNNRVLIEKNIAEINSNKEKIARLEGAISVLLNKSLSQSHKVLISPKKSQGNIETKVINRLRRSKKSLIMAEINKLSPSMSVIEMFEDIVLSKGLCSKASFYRYVSSLKSQSLLKNKTNLRQK